MGVGAVVDGRMAKDVGVGAVSQGTADDPGDNGREAMAGSGAGASCRGNGVGMEHGCEGGQTSTDTGMVASGCAGDVGEGDGSERPKGSRFQGSARPGSELH